MKNHSLSLLQSFEHQVKTQGNQVYMTQPRADGSVLELTWSQVDEQARRMANYLTSLCLPARSHIILSLQNCAHWIIADLAIWMAGHVTVALYPTLNVQASCDIIAHSDAQFIIFGRTLLSEDQWKELIDKLPQRLPLLALCEVSVPDAVLWKDIQTKFAPIQNICNRGPEELATIVYTSGTTGTPKGVMHCFRSLTAPCQCSKTLWQPSSKDRMLSYLPLAHIAERVAVEIPSIMFGFQLFFNHSLQTFEADLKRARPTRFFSVPRLWTKFYQGVNSYLSPKKQRWIFALPLISGWVKSRILKKLGLDQVQVALTGAAPLPNEIIDWYRNLGLELLEVFGMTENAAASHATRLGEHKTGYVGTPLDGVQCRIDGSGEVLVKSPGQMLGYYKMQDITHSQFTPDGFFHTGDCGVVDTQGRLKITGRVKELFKTSKGKYVAPAAIENQLGAHPAIEVCCITGPGQPQPFVLVMLAPGIRSKVERQQQEADFSELLDRVNPGLEKHERLAYMVVVKEVWNIENGYVTPTMKLRREIIEQRYLPNADSWRAMNRKIIWE
jgi:long-chain acyl-CoA synthetase